MMKINKQFILFSLFSAFTILTLAQEQQYPKSMSGCECISSCKPLPTHPEVSTCQTSKKCGKRNTTIIPAFSWDYCSNNKPLTDSGCICDTPCVINLQSSQPRCKTNACGMKKFLNTSGLTSLSSYYYLDTCKGMFLNTISEEKNRKILKAYNETSTRNTGDQFLVVRELSKSGCECQTICGSEKIESESICRTSSKCGVFDSVKNTYYDVCQGQLDAEWVYNNEVSASGEDDDASSQYVVQIYSEIPMASGGTMMPNKLTNGNAATDGEKLIASPNTSEQDMNLPIIGNTGIVSDNGCGCISSCGISYSSTVAWCKVSDKCETSSNNGKYRWDACNSAFLAEKVVPYNGVLTILSGVSWTSISILTMAQLLIMDLM